MNMTQPTLHPQITPVPTHAPLPARATDKPLTYDYSRSFLQWVSEWDNIPRCAIHASCRLQTRGAPEREFFLAHPCAGETMYVAKDIIQYPPADFTMTCEPGKEYMIVKVLAEDPIEMRMAHRIGETVPTRDGRGSRITQMDVHVRSFPSVRELRTDREVSEAMRANLPLTGRSSFLSDDGATTVISEYPVTVMNARPSDLRWQVDTGPVLMPDSSLKSQLTVAQFRQAYLVYNSWDWAELMMRQPTPIRDNGYAVMHYSSPRRVVMHNQLFAADI